MIHFTVLGEIGLTGAPDPEAILRQPKRLALLALLASPTPGTWHRRDILLPMFWPEFDAARARTALRNALYVIRQHVGQHVVRTRGDEDISVDPELLQTDLGALWEGVREGNGEAVIAGYRGELLPGLFPPDSDGFQRWLDEERARLRREVSRVGNTWVEQLQAGGRFREGLEAARRLAEIDPDDEATARRLMALHEAAGDRAGGLVVFERLRRRLQAEFGAEPAPQTVALSRRMRESLGAAGGAPEPLVPGRESVPGSLTDALPLVRRRRASPAVLTVLAIVTVLPAGFAARTLLRASPPLAVGASTPLTADEGLQIEPAISPNGRMVAFAAGTSRAMRVRIRKLAGGEEWPLTRDSSAVELMPRWSPDGDDILYLARNSAFVSSAVQGNPRLIAAGGDGDAMVRSASWSPGGDSVVIVRNDSITVRPLEGSGARLVGQGSQLHSCVWSPASPWIACVSGNWVAFTPGPLFGNRAPTSVVLYPAAGGDPIPITDHNSEHQSPAWSADGRFLWLLSDRDGVSGEVYAVPVGPNGKASGPWVRAGLTAHSISLAGSRMAYSVYSRTQNIWSIPIPATGMASLSMATRLTSGNQIVEIVRASVDGQWLVYDSNLRGNSDIYRVPIAGGAPDRLTDDARPEFAGELTRDNTELVYHMWIGGERRVMVKRLASGEVTEVPYLAGDVGTPRWSPDALGIVAWSHVREAGALGVIRRDSAGRWLAPWRLDDAQLPAWSPDGSVIAYVTLAGSVQSIPADSGSRRVLYAPRSGADPQATYLWWGDSTERLWFLGHDGQARGGIWQLQPGRGGPRLVVSLHDSTGRYTNGPTFSSDGSRFYFTLDERRSNVRWAELIRRR